MEHVFAILLFLSCFCLDEAYGQDAAKSFRCKCVCPKSVSLSGRQTVYVKALDDARDCECFDVVSNATVEMCLRCECLVESINAPLIKAIVVFILIFFLTLLAVLLLQFIHQACRKKKGLSVLADDQLVEQQRPKQLPRARRYDLQSMDEPAITRSWRREVAHRAINAFGGIQAQIEQQRYNVYDRQNILS